MTGTQNSLEGEIVHEFLTARTENAFGALFHAFYPQLLRYFLVRGRSPDIAEELAQDVLTTVYRKADTLRERGSFRPWLFTIAQNALRQHLRRGQDEVPLQQMDWADAKSPGGLMENDGFLGMIGILDEDDRHLMMLRYIDDLSYAEIAETLSMPMGTVKWKLFDCKSRIGAALRPDKEVRR